MDFDLIVYGKNIYIYILLEMLWILMGNDMEKSPVHLGNFDGFRF